MFFKNIFNKKETKSFSSINCINTSHATSSLWNEQKNYGNNPIVFRSIQLISECANSMKIIVDDEKIQSYLKKHFGDMVRELLIHGNCFIHRDLLLISPHRVAINTNKYHQVTGYTIHNTLYDKNQILHLKYCNTHHISRDFFSVSPIQICAPWVEIYQFIQNYISTMVQYGGKPSGILSYTSMMNEKDRITLKEQFKELYSNVNRGGAVILTSSNIAWQPIGMEPDKLHLLDNLQQATKEIANCFGVPSILLGDTERATFSNYTEARRQLWEDVVIPLSTNLIGKISEFFNKDIEVNIHNKKEED